MRIHVFRRRPQPRARGAASPGGDGGGARPTACPASRSWAGRHRGEGVARARARGAAANGFAFRTTSASPSAWRRPTCPGIGAASTCRSRWASWPPRATSTRPAWRASSSPASCRWPVNCGRCAARWRWRWRCAAPQARAAWYCRPTVRGRPRRSRVWTSAPRKACCRWCRRCSRARHRSTCRAPSPCRLQAPGRASTCATSRDRPAPSGRWKSPPPAPQPAAGRPRRAPASRCWRSACRASCRRWTRPRALASAALQGLTSQGFDAASFGRRPFRAPHHSASAVALIGGGSPPRQADIAGPWRRALPRRAARIPAPGARSLARTAGKRLDHHLARAGGALRPLPAGRGDEPLPLRMARRLRRTGKHCRCHADAIARYQGRLSGRCSTASTCRSRCWRSRRRS